MNDSKRCLKDSVTRTELQKNKRREQQRQLQIAKKNELRDKNRTSDYEQFLKKYCLDNAMIDECALSFFFQNFLQESCHETFDGNILKDVFFLNLFANSCRTNQRYQQVILNEIRENEASFLVKIAHVEDFEAASLFITSLEHFPLDESSFLFLISLLFKIILDRDVNSVVVENTALTASSCFYCSDLDLEFAHYALSKIDLTTCNQERLLFIVLPLSSLSKSFYTYLPKSTNILSFFNSSSVLDTMLIECIVDNEEAVDTSIFPADVLQKYENLFDKIKKERICYI